ncbi:MAG: alpha-E domain-containing protein [Minwuia sp.]|nr:alpha-E domain-containing protein [Minwuia sp.]
MLSRTADDLFWMSRYVERAENVARLLEVADRMALMPQDAGGTDEWTAVLIAGGVAPLYTELVGKVEADPTLRFMALSPENPSSIYNCFSVARENARAQRHTITRELWEAINDTWHGIRDMTPEKVEGMGHTAFFEWVKSRSHLVRGALAGTMIRDDAYSFTRLGTFIERADSTSRILDVKYHLILPTEEVVGGAPDYYQWAALLQSVSAQGSYRRMFGDQIRYTNVAELLVLRPEMPRSVRSCYDNIMENLQNLTDSYESQPRCLRMAGKLRARLVYGEVAEFTGQESGLHEFLTEVVGTNLQIAAQIGKDFLLTPENEDTPLAFPENARQEQTMG